MCAFSRKMEKSTPLWCEDCRFVSFETGLGKPMRTLDDPNGFKNSTNVYSIHLELRMALPCQISTGKLKYVNPCLDFLGIPDQRTAYVKRQARPRWTYVRRSSVTPDLIIQWWIFALRSRYGHLRHSMDIAVMFGTFVVTPILNIPVVYIDFY